jgi:tyrosine-protein kinase Etk/Wzc
MTSQSSDSAGHLAQISEDAEISLLDLVLTLAENLRLLIIGPLLVGVAVLGASFLISPTFTASTLLMGPQQPQTVAGSLAQQLQSGPLGALGGAARALRDPNEQYVSMLKSRTVEDRLVEQFELVSRYKVELKEDARNLLEARTRISASRDNMIRLEFDDADPAFAARVANAYVAELSRLMKALALTEAQHRRAFFDRLVTDTRDKLAKAQAALAATGVNPAALRGSPEATVGPLAQLQAQIRLQEVRLGVMRGYLVDSAPEYVRAQDELAALRAQFQKAGASMQAPNSESDYSARFREFKYQEALLDLLSRQYEVARIDESREGAVIQVVDSAVPPERKSKPKKAQIAIAATAVSAIVLILFVLMRQAWRKSVVTPEVSSKLQRLRVLIFAALGRKYA